MLNRRETILTSPDLYGDAVRMVVGARSMTAGDPTEGTWRVFTALQSAADPYGMTDDLALPAEWSPITTTARTGAWRHDAAKLEYENWVRRYEAAGWMVTERREWREDSAFENRQSDDDEAERRVLRLEAPHVFDTHGVTVPLEPGMLLRNDDETEWWVVAPLTRGHAPLIPDMIDGGGRIALYEITKDGAEMLSPALSPAAVTSEQELYYYSRASDELMDAAKFRVAGEGKSAEMIDLSTGHDWEDHQ